MFQYLENKQKFVIKLGQYISHEIISHDKPDDYNNLDRLNLAYSFLDWLPLFYAHYLDGSISREDLAWDIALYIDKRIPQSYIKWRDELHELSPSKVIASQYTTGLIYHFKENRNLSSPADAQDEKLLELYKNLDAYYEQIYGLSYHLVPQPIRKEGISYVLNYITSPN